MKSLRSHEGYFLLDHRNSPGMPDAVAIATGLPAGAGQGIFEAPSYTCRHCQRIVILNPKRNRERAYCRGCDHMICDDCGAERARTLTCRTFDQMVDEMLSKASIVY
jgi:hypothetical protein